MRPKAAAIAGVFFILISFPYSKADELNNSFPEKCAGTGFEYRGGGIVLNSDSQNSQSLYLLNNISENEYWITHQVKNPGASAGWTSDISPGSWSAFAVNTPGFDLTCVKEGQGRMETLSCEKVLRVCRISNPVFKPDTGGSYWVSEDKTLEAVLAEIKSRGISF